MNKKYDCPALSEIMERFCSIVMPGHNKRKGYINVSKLVKELGCNRRTYYHWKNLEALPRLDMFVRLLNERGYKVSIEPDYSLYEK